MNTAKYAHETLVSRIELAGSILGTIGGVLILAALAMWTPWMRTQYATICFFTGAAFALSSALTAVCLGELRIPIAETTPVAVAVTKPQTQILDRELTEAQKSEAGKLILIICLGYERLRLTGNPRLEEKVTALREQLGKLFPEVNRFSDEELVNALRETIISAGGMCD